MSRNSNQDNIEPKKSTKIKPVWVLSALGLVAIVAIGLSLSSGNSKKNVPITTPTVTASPTPSSTVPADLFAAADTPEKLANLPKLYVIDSSGKAYQTCLSQQKDKVHESCIELKNKISVKMASKIEYDVRKLQIYNIYKIIEEGINGYPSGLFVDGVDYTKKEGTRKLPSAGLIYNLYEKNKFILDGSTIYLYSNPQTGTDYCISNVSMDGKLNFRLDSKSLGVVSLGKPCSNKG